LFEALKANGSNYLEWSINVRSYLSVEELDNILESPSPKGPLGILKWKVLHILRRHLDVSFRQQYTQVDNPHNLWEELEARFHHKKTIFLLQACND